MPEQHTLEVEGELIGHATLAALLASTTMGHASENDAARCSPPDLMTIAVIDLQSMLAADNPASLAEAYRMVLRARALCAAGEVDAALSLYDMILPGVTSTTEPVLAAWQP